LTHIKHHPPSATAHASDLGELEFINPQKRGRAASKKKSLTTVSPALTRAQSRLLSGPAKKQTPRDPSQDSQGSASDTGPDSKKPRVVGAAGTSGEGTRTPTSKPVEFERDPRRRKQGPHPSPLKRKIDEHPSATVPKQPTIHPVSSARKTYFLKDCQVVGDKVTLPQGKGTMKITVPLQTFKKLYERKEGIPTKMLENLSAQLPAQDDASIAATPPAAQGSDTQKVTEPSSGISQ